LFDKGELHNTSLTGCAKYIMATAKDYNVHAYAAELDFQTKKYLTVLIHP